MFQVILTIVHLKTSEYLPQPTIVVLAENEYEAEDKARAAAETLFDKLNIKVNIDVYDTTRISSGLFLEIPESLQNTLDELSENIHGD